MYLTYKFYLFRKISVVYHHQALLLELKMEVLEQERGMFSVADVIVICRT